MALMLFFVGAHAQNSVEKVKIGDTMPQFTLNSDVYGLANSAATLGFSAINTAFIQLSYVLFADFVFMYIWICFLFDLLYTFFILLFL